MIGDRSLIEEFQKTTAVIGTDHFFFFLIGDRSFTDQMIGDRDICAKLCILSVYNLRHFD